jgi:hypothetical protein
MDPVSIAVTIALGGAILKLIQIIYNSLFSSGDVTDIKLSHTSNYVHVGEIEVWGKDGKKIPLVGAKATQSSTGWSRPAKKAIDGNRKSINQTQKATSAKPQWLNIKLGSPIPTTAIDKIVVYNRPDKWGVRLKSAKLHVMSHESVLKTHDFTTGGKNKYEIKL